MHMITTKINQQLLTLANVSKQLCSDETAAC